MFWEKTANCSTQSDHSNTKIKLYYATAMPDRQNTMTFASMSSNIMPQSIIYIRWWLPRLQWLEIIYNYSKNAQSPHPLLLLSISCCLSQVVLYLHSYFSFPPPTSRGLAQTGVWETSWQTKTPSDKKKKNTQKTTTDFVKTAVLILLETMWRCSVSPKTAEANEIS